MLPRQQREYHGEKASRLLQLGGEQCGHVPQQSSHHFGAGICVGVRLLEDLDGKYWVGSGKKNKTMSRERRKERLV